MDILDIMLAKAMTPQGKTDAYVAKANKAAQTAAKAQQDAEAAVATVAAAASDIADTQSAAATLLETAQSALETAQAAQNNLPTAYATTGQNTDGYMTQKATTDALAGKVDTATLNSYATKAYVDAKPSGGGNATISFDEEDKGYLTMVGTSGNLVASTIREDTIVETLLQMGTFPAKDAVGLDIDYMNRSFTRVQEAANKNMGSDFNSFTMYGGRTKCNVADDGTINAFYGDSNYREDGSNGQVMIYQPKFYYKRIIRMSEELVNGTAVRHETLILSSTEQAGFKLAPIFGDGLEYVLLPAFDGSLVNDKLSSIAGVKPLNNVTIAQAESYANARGQGWHIMNMAAESANQMLQIVEFGTMNGQSAIEQGITNIPQGSNGNCYFITGSTSSLGNGTGHASSTQVDVGGNISTVTEDGYRAIIYRGMENPWGNLWSMIGGLNIVGNGAQQGGTPYICKDFSYTPTVVGNNYESVGFNLPAICEGYVNAMGYGKEEYDWVYLPIECSNTATSLLPVGDGLWSVAGLNAVNLMATGGSFGQKELCGPFNYAADRIPNDSARNNYGAKLLFIPTKNATYTANIAKWETYMGE